MAWAAGWSGVAAPARWTPGLVRELGPDVRAEPGSSAPVLAGVGRLGKVRGPDGRLLVGGHQAGQPWMDRESCLLTLPPKLLGLPA